MTLLLFVFVGFSAFAQQDSIEALIKTGIEFHDQRKYENAIEWYEKALKIDKKSALANYEIALSYYHLREYKKALKYSKKALKYGENKLSTYILQGGILDEMGKTEKSIKLYEKALEEYPYNYLLFYNLGVSYFNNGEIDKSEKVLIKAIRNKPTHPGSHLLLAYVQNQKQLQIRSLLPMYFFLFLEPVSPRSAQAYDFLRKKLEQGVGSSGKNTNSNITHSDTVFAAAKMIIGMYEASRKLESNKNQFDFFAEKNQLIFETLASIKQEKSGFWWDFYISFFAGMLEKGYVERFSYYISQCTGRAEVEQWIEKNQGKMQEWDLWSEQFK